jgi:hypothetical protein
VAAQHLEILIQEQAREFDLLTDIRTNHLREMIEKEIRMAF